MHGNMNIKFVKIYLPSISAYKIMKKYYYVFYSLPRSNYPVC